MATTAWPNWIPVRLSLAVSTGQADARRAPAAALADALTATVAATVAISNQAGPVTVRSLVHSACSASRMPVRPAVPRGGGGQLGRRPGLAHASLGRIRTTARPRASRGPGAQHAEASPRREWEVAGSGRAEGGDLRVLGAGLLMAKAAAGVSRSSQSRTPTGRSEATRQDVREHDRHDDDADRGHAAAQYGAEGQGQHGGHRAAAPRCRRPAAVRCCAIAGNTYALCALSGPRGSPRPGRDQAGHESDRADHEGLAASTRPRRGLAASAMRIRPRRYSAVMNMAATPAPRSARRTCLPAGRGVSVGLLASDPAMTGAMSPDPVTVNRPPAW